MISASRGRWFSLSLWATGVTLYFAGLPSPTAGRLAAPAVCICPSLVL